MLWILGVKQLVRCKSNGIPSGLGRCFFVRGGDKSDEKICK